MTKIAKLRGGGAGHGGDKAQAQAPSLPAAARAYVTVIGLAGAAALAFTLWGWTPHFSTSILIYAAIAVASSGMKVTLPGVRGTMSMSYVFTLLALEELAVPETMLLSIVASLVQSLWHTKERAKPIQLVFNAANTSVAVLACASVYGQRWVLGGSSGQLLRLTLAGIVYFAINTFSVSTIIALSERHSPRAVWKGYFNWSFAFYLVGVSLAEIMRLSIERLGWTFTLTLLPILYVLHRSYTLYTGRIGQEKLHAENMAALHLRTVEALAMAIEAKDECTHKHLRRVQVYSLKIAEKLALSSEEIQALQAASILHDIGKLAVPDYIISKPGKLTPQEFEKMKIHTVVGAAILEQVGFPFAVPAIVRSHHEKWDGSGYPDGLKGEEIPIGARILSAVDCLDALASDRQYRRALPLDKAMDYVASLAGQTFDSRVVEILKRNYREFEAYTDLVPLRESVLAKTPVVSRGEAPDAGFEQERAGRPNARDDAGSSLAASLASARHEFQSLIELAGDLGESLALEEILGVMAQRLNQLVPFECIAIYIQEGLVLKPKYVNGDGSGAFANSDIPVGEGLSGWVAENARPIVNGNPAVEPGYANAASRFTPLESALAVPLTAEQFSGVLTLYRTERDAFSKDELRLLLAAASKVSIAIENIARLPRNRDRGLTDPLTGLANAKALYPYLEQELAACRDKSKGLAIMVCDLDGFKHVNDSFGHVTGDELLKRAGGIFRENCRDTDYVARIGGDEFAIVLAGAGPDEIRERIESIERMLRQANRDLCGEECIGVSAGVACYPQDGSDPEALLSRADAELSRKKRERKKPPVMALRPPRPIVQVA